MEFDFVKKLKKLKKDQTKAGMVLNMDNPVPIRHKSKQSLLNQQKKIKQEENDLDINEKKDKEEEEEDDDYINRMRRAQKLRRLKKHKLKNVSSSFFSADFNIASEAAATHSQPLKYSVRKEKHKIKKALHFSENKKKLRNKKINSSVILYL